LGVKLSGRSTPSPLSHKVSVSPSSRYLHRNDGVTAFSLITPGDADVSTVNFERQQTPPPGRTKETRSPATPHEYRISRPPVGRRPPARTHSPWSVFISASAGVIFLGRNGAGAAPSGRARSSTTSRRMGPPC